MKQISISFLILIVISLELCTFFISTAFASKTLTGHELAKINQCEKKFWWKNRKKFQKDFENRCMKQQHDRHDKYKKRFHKNKECDKSEPWNLKSWTNKKNTWENRDQRKCKSLKDKGRWKKSQKLLWEQFQKLSDCKCSAPNYKVTNPAGISICYQIASLNKASGSFIGSFTIFRSVKYDELKGKPALIAAKYDEDIKVKVDGSNKDDYGFFNLKPLFTFKVKGSDGNIILVSKAFIEGNLPSKKSMNKICIDDISPVKYKVKVKVDKDTKKVFGLKLSSDVKNIPLSKFIPSKPYSPYLIEPPNNNPGKNKEQPTTTITQTQDQSTTPSQNQDQPTTISQSPDPNQPTPTDPAPADPAPTDPAPADPAPTDPALTNNPNAINNPNQPDPTPANQNSNQGVNSISPSSNPPAPVTNADSTAAAANEPVPGSSISTPPIGLIVFAVVVAVGAAFVGYTTYERRRYRNQFNRRQNMQQQNPSLAAVPDFGRAV